MVSIFPSQNFLCNETNNFELLFCVRALFGFLGKPPLTAQAKRVVLICLKKNRRLRRALYSRALSNIVLCIVYLATDQIVHLFHIHLLQTELSKKGFTSSCQVFFFVFNKTTRSAWNNFNQLSRTFVVRFFSLLRILLWACAIIVRIFSRHPGSQLSNKKK